MPPLPTSEKGRCVSLHDCPATGRSSWPWNKCTDADNIAEQFALKNWPHDQMKKEESIVDVVDELID